MTAGHRPESPGATSPPMDFTDFYQAHFHRLAVQLYAYLGDHAEAQDLPDDTVAVVTSTSTILGTGPGVERSWTHLSY
ncbi:hypothetical protein [Micromonospora craterilacus]|uniref:hypothetical protein n=1 Tax=Micromonospora craterilacus TaxID=1655439 RepID=UPI001F27CE21|nr:hypothetical protein [Micromonospora craterilacus]